jgi:hypothetical protein
MNIIWKKPEGGIAITVMAQNDISLKDCESHASELLKRRDVDPEFTAVGYGVNLPEDREWRAAWDFEDGKIVVNMEMARKITLERLRTERVEAFKINDIALRDAILNDDVKAKMAAIAERDRLRDITLKAERNLSLDELAELTV